MQGSLLNSSGRITLKACKNVIMLVRNSRFCMQLLNKPAGNESTKISVKYMEIDVISKDHFQNVEAGITRGLKRSGRGRARQRRSWCGPAAPAGSGICQLAWSEINPPWYGLWTWAWPLMRPPARPVLPEVARDCLALRSGCGRPQSAQVNGS